VVPFWPCFGRADLAADQGRPGATLGTGAMTLAQNFATEAEVDAAYDLALRNGAIALEESRKRFSGADIPATTPIRMVMCGKLQ
jgi:hypothetical protein